MVESCAGGEPGVAALLEAIAQLASVELAGRHDDGLGERLLTLHRASNALHAEILRTTAAFETGGAWERDGALGAASWIRARTRMPAGWARTQVREARLLRDTLPLMAASLADGRVSPAHVKVLAAVCGSTPERIATVTSAEPTLVSAAEALDPAAFRQVVSRWTCAVDPDAARRDAKQQHEARGLSVSTTFAGMVAVDGLLDPEGGAVLLAALAAASGGAPSRDDTRNPRQRRADALVDLCRFQLDHADTGVIGGERPHVMLTIPVDVVNGTATCGAQLSDGHPLTADAALTWWCDASVVPVLIDDGGTPLDVGRARRTIPPSIRRAVVMRDEGCVFAGCDRGPGWSDVHHVVEWSRGGTTSLANCVLLCRRHHRLVHVEGFALAGPPGPGMRTVRPDGRTIVLAGPAP